MDMVLEEPEIEAEEIKIQRNSPIGHLTATKASFKSENDTSALSTATTSNVSSTLEQHSPETPSRRRMASPETIRKVGAIVEKIVHSLHQQDEKVSIRLKTRQSSGTFPSYLRDQPLDGYYKLSFPGSTPQEAWRFSTAGLTETAMLIDDVDKIQSIDISDVVWILVVEKESTFRTLHTSKVHETMSAGKGIILTAKGYPDVSTRAFLRLLSLSSYPLPPVFALVDFDPDGIAIMSTYKHGSFTLSHENANLKTPTIRWLGVKSGDLSLDIAKYGPRDTNSEKDGLLRLSRRDRKKAVKMLDREICEEYGAEQGWRRELQVMLMLNMKVEMEILSEEEGGVEGWVEKRLSEELNEYIGRC
ncbi:MAG: hypothetical protein Q9170_008061 [Blastenia crenularia]